MIPFLNVKVRLWVVMAILVAFSTFSIVLSSKSNRIARENEQRLHELEMQYISLKQDYYKALILVDRMKDSISIADNKIKDSEAERRRLLRDLYEKNTLLGSIVTISNISADSADKYYTGTVIPDLRKRFGGYIKD